MALQSPQGDEYDNAVKEIELSIEECLSNA